MWPRCGLQGRRAWGKGGRAWGASKVATCVLVYYLASPGASPLGGLHAMILGGFLLGANLGFLCCPKLGFRHFRAWGALQHPEQHLGTSLEGPKTLWKAATPCCALGHARNWAHMAFHILGVGTHTP